MTGALLCGVMLSLCSFINSVICIYMSMTTGFILQKSSPVWFDATYPEGNPVKLCCYLLLVLFLNTTHIIQ